jgi:hypothetical protein
MSDAPRSGQQVDGYLSEASVTLLIQNLFNNYKGPTIISSSRSSHPPSLHYSCILAIAAPIPLRQGMLVALVAYSNHVEVCAVAPGGV